MLLGTPSEAHPTSSRPFGIRPHLSHLGPAKVWPVPDPRIPKMQASGISNSLKIISPTLLNTQVRVDLVDLAVPGCKRIFLGALFDIFKDLFSLVS